MARPKAKKIIFEIPRNILISAICLLLSANYLLFSSDFTLQGDRLINTSGKTLFNVKIYPEGTKEGYWIAREFYPEYFVKVVYDKFKIKYSLIFNNQLLEKEEKFEKEEKEQAYLPLDIKIDPTESRWYNRDTYLLILKTEVPCTFTVLDTSLLYFEETINEKQGDSINLRHIPADIVVMGLNVRINTRRAVFYLKIKEKKETVQPEKKYIDVWILVEREGRKRRVKYTIERK